MAEKQNDIIEISRGGTTAQVNRNNGQLFSLKRGDTDVMWGGGGPKNFVALKGWPENSELVMFPFIGPAPNKELIIRGKRYPMAARHGPARFLPWDTSQINPAKATMIQSYVGGTEVIGPGPADISVLPYSYKIEKECEVLENGRLMIRLGAVNESDSPLLYTKGWHPTFMVPPDPADQEKSTLTVTQNNGECKTVTLNEIKASPTDSVIFFPDSLNICYETPQFEMTFLHNFGNTLLWYNGKGFIGIEPISEKSLERLTDGKSADLDTLSAFKEIAPGRRGNTRTVLITIELRTG